MEWPKEIQQLFDNLTAGVPEGFRPMVSAMLKETAEKKCKERNAGILNEADLITALIEITPEPFKAESIENMKKHNVDVEKYIELKSIRDKYKVSWESFEKAFHPGNIHFAMYVTDKCNQECIHCAADSKAYRPDLSFEDWVKIIDNLEDGLKEEGRNGVYVWFGGEPTCRPDLKKLIEYCGSKNYYQALITNGINFTDDFAKYCADNGMSHIFVSIDSANPEISDKIRGVKGSSDHAKKAIENSLKYGLFTCCSTTVMKQNVHHLQDIKDLCEELGAQPYFRAIVKQRNAANNWDEVGLSKEEYKLLHDFKYKNAIEKIESGNASNLPVYEIYEMVPFMQHPKNDYELTALEWGVGCQACRTLMGIDVNGDIFPCGYPSELLLGNALTTDFKEVLNSQTFKDIRNGKRVGKCNSCEFLSLCKGGCRVHTECETGDYFESFPYCWHECELSK